MRNFGLALVLSLGIAAAANAANTYTDEATFLGDILPGYYLEDFDGYTYGYPLDGSQTDADFGPVNGWAWHAYAEFGLWSNPGALSVNSADDVLMITFPGDPVTACGGIIASTDIDGYTIPQDITATLDDGTEITLTGLGFAGFTSAAPIVSLTLDAVDDPEFNWPQLDHFYVGALVPEPGSLSLLAFGALALLRRR